MKPNWVTHLRANVIPEELLLAISLYLEVFLRKSAIALRHSAAHVPCLTNMLSSVFCILNDSLAVHVLFINSSFITDGHVFWCIVNA